MTKSNEIAIIADCAQKLGSNSYCGEWLKSILPEIESLIQSDMIPTITISQTLSQCNAMRKEAVEYCKKITSQALADSEKIVTETHSKSNAIRMMLRRDIQKALDIV